jgi:hypothetical protein
MRGIVAKSLRVLVYGKDGSHRERKQEADEYGTVTNIKKSKRYAYLQTKKNYKLMKAKGQV